MPGTSEQLVWVLLYRDLTHTECDVYLSEESFLQGVLDMIRVDEILVPSGLDREALLRMPSDPEFNLDEMMLELHMATSPDVVLNYFVRTAH